MAETVTLGQVSIISKGAWSSSTTYAVLEMVTNKGGSWLCKKANSNKQPGVTSGWATYWVQAAKGIDTIDVTSPSSGTVQMVINYSDGTNTTVSYSSSAIAAGSIGTTELADGAVTSAKIGTGEVKNTNIYDGAVTSAKIGTKEVKTTNIADNAVTAAKLATNLTYTAVNLASNQVRVIKDGTASPPTTSDISNGQIYLSHS